MNQERFAATKHRGDIVSRWEEAHDGHRPCIRLVHPREHQRCTRSYPVGAARVLAEIGSVVGSGRSRASQERSINTIDDAAYFSIELIRGDARGCDGGAREELAIQG